MRKGIPSSGMLRFDGTYCLHAWFQASVAVWMKSSLFWDVTQRTLVVTDVSGQPIGTIFKAQAI